MHTKSHRAVAITQGHTTTIKTQGFKCNTLTIQLFLIYLFFLSLLPLFLSLSLSLVPPVSLSCCELMVLPGTAAFLHHEQMRGEENKRKERSREERKKEERREEKRRKRREEKRGGEDRTTLEH